MWFLYLGFPHAGLFVMADLMCFLTVFETAENKSGITLAVLIDSLYAAAGTMLANGINVVQGVQVH